MEFHPVANIFPLIQGEEYQSLKTDIFINGLLEPIWLAPDGRILDGRNRWRACVDAGIEPRFRQYEGNDSTTAMIRFVLSLNKERRHLTSSQMAAAAIKAEEIMTALEAEAKERQKESGRLYGENHPKEVDKIFYQPLPENGRTPQTIDTAAELFGTNRQYVSKAKSLNQTAPDVLEQVANGKLSISDGGKLAKLPKKKREKVIDRLGDKKTNVNKLIREVEREEQIAAIEPVKSSWLYVGDMRQVGSEIPDDSVNMIFTDPPYDKEAVKLYGALAALALRVLKPGGICLAYSGQLHIPHILPLMSEHLEYMWLCGIGHSDGSTWFKKWNLDNQWKPLIMFGKPPIVPYWKRFNDFVSGGKEKADHEWQQSLSEAEHYIKSLCVPGGVVLDPFLGSGTTLVAAKKLGMQYIGIEIDEVTAFNAEKRVNDASE